MPLTHDERWQAASLVRSQLLRRQRATQRRAVNRLGQATARLQRLERIRGLLDRITVCGWYAASRRLTQEACRLLDAAADDGRTFGRTLAPDTPAPSPRAVYEEIVQAEQEFVDVRYDRNRRVLTAVTGDITLEGLYLGPFGVELHLDHLDEPVSPALYTVEALDPKPARCDEAVTHPHVRDGGLCAGDAGAAIGAALAGGRVCDFFLLVRSVLETYNPSSPYVSLADWDGAVCADCDATVPADDCYYCMTCDSALCDTCACNCTCCNETTCRSCLDRCPECEELVCPDCLTTCPDCRRVLCKACLEDGCPCTEETDEDGHDEGHGDVRPAAQAVQEVFQTA